MSVKPEDWNPLTQRMHPESPNAARLNNHLSRLFLRAGDAFLAITLTDEEYTMEDLVARVDLWPRNKVRYFLNGIVDPFEKHILALKSKCLGCEQQGNYLQIGECGHHPASSHIAMVVYTIPCKLFADVKNFTEFYDEIVLQ